MIDCIYVKLFEFKIEYMLKKKNEQDKEFRRLQKREFICLNNLNFSCL